MRPEDIEYFQGGIIDWLFDQLRSDPPKVIRMVTFTFIPEGWVKQVLDRNECHVWCSGPTSVSPKEFAARWPFSKLFLCQDSHGKALIAQGHRSFYGFFGSLNMVPTSSMEITCRIYGRRAEEMFFQISNLATPRIQLADIDLTKPHYVGVPRA